MTLTQTAATQTTRPHFSFAFLMSGLVLKCTWFSSLMGAVFSRGFGTGVQHDHLISAGIVWIFGAIARGLV